MGQPPQISVSFDGDPFRFEGSALPMQHVLFNVPKPIAMTPASSSRKDVCPAATEASPDPGIYQPESTGVSGGSFIDCFANSITRTKSAASFGGVVASDTSLIVFR